MPGTPEKESSGCDVVASAVAGPAPLRARALPQRGAPCAPGPPAPLAGPLRRVAPDVEKALFSSAGRRRKTTKKHRVDLAIP